MTTEEEIQSAKDAVAKDWGLPNFKRLKAQGRPDLEGFYDKVCDKLLTLANIQLAERDKFNEETQEEVRQRDEMIAEQKTINFTAMEEEKLKIHKEIEVLKQALRKHKEYIFFSK